MTDTRVAVQNKLLTAALAYAARGWPVFQCHTVINRRCSCGDPTCKSQGKHPRGEHGLKEGTAEPAMIRSWWAKCPEANVAIVTGAPSGLVVLDVDPDKGGTETLYDLQQQHGQLPPTPESLTGGGGTHLLFQHPGVPIKNSAGVLGPGLDVRGDGGYIIVSPSKHVSGGVYEWDIEHHPDRLAPPPLPAWLLTLLSDKRDGHHIIEAIGEIIGEGQRNATLTSLAGTMRRRGASQTAILAALRAENTARCQPAIEDAEIQKIAASVARYAPGPTFLDGEGPDQGTGDASGGPQMAAVEAAIASGQPDIRRPEVLEVVGRWLRMTDVEAIDTIMATAGAIYLPGDPLWLQVVAPPGGTKSEMLRALQGPRVVSISTLTPQSLISGLKGKGTDIDLLPHLDGKLLIIKDFTSILSKKTEDSTAIFADLREAYDGYLEKSFGSGVGIKGYHATFGVIAGVTPAIDMYRTVHALLGERFLRVNVVGDEDGAIARASQLEGQEKQMREELGRTIGGYLTRAGEWTSPDILVEQRFLEQLRALARITAALRSAVARDRRHYVLYPPQREIGTRLVKQLQKLAKALANWRERVLVSAEDYATVRRVALDGIPHQRLAVLTVLLAAEGWMATRQVGQGADLPTESAGEALEDMWMLGLVLREGDSAYQWAVTDETRDLLERAAIDPGTQTTPRQREEASRE